MAQEAKPKGRLADWLPFRARDDYTRGEHVTIGTRATRSAGPERKRRVNSVCGKRQSLEAEHRTIGDGGYSRRAAARHPALELVYESW
jgi:hypothetical protein